MLQLKTKNNLKYFDNIMLIINAIYATESQLFCLYGDKE